MYLVYGWSYSISADLSDIVRVDLDSLDFAWEEFSTNLQYTRDSFAISYTPKDLYIFGGYIASISTDINDLVRLDPDTGNFTVVTQSGAFPGSRSAPSVQLVSASIYIFGGQGMDSFYDDMWVYNINLDIWTPIYQSGSIPLPRWKHATHSQGSAIVIWGGEGASGLLNDLFIFNTLTNSWSPLEKGSNLFPVAGIGACMILDMPYIYIFGVLTDLGCLGQLWVYDMGTSLYSLIPSSGPQLAISPAN